MKARDPACIVRFDGRPIRADGERVPPTYYFWHPLYPAKARMTLHCPLAGHGKIQSSGSASRGLCQLLNICSQ